jgi:hypothetical protein
MRIDAEDYDDVKLVIGPKLSQLSPGHYNVQVTDTYVKDRVLYIVHDVPPVPSLWDRVLAWVRKQKEDWQNGGTSLDS